MEKILEKNRKAVDSQLRRFLPAKAEMKWLCRMFGAKAYDVDAINNFLSKPTWDLLNRGGKRWRPLLMFLACGAVGGDPRSISKYAVIPELIHNGSIIADDVEDSSPLRRGNAALQVKYGIDVAVNLGSLLYYLPLILLKDSNLRKDIRLKAYETINDELLNLHLGQGTDIEWHKKAREVSEAKYFAMCANKTGTLARLSAKLGVILGNGHDKQIEGLGKFGESLGIAFQIKDDILNLSGGIGKKTGEDITEGKMSLPAIRTLGVAKRADRKELLEILKKHTANEGAIRKAILIMEKYNAIGYSDDVANRIVKKAWENAEFLIPGSDFKSNLQKLALFSVERKN